MGVGVCCGVWGGSRDVCMCGFVAWRLGVVGFGGGRDEKRKQTGGVIIINIADCILAVDK